MDAVNGVAVLMSPDLAGTGEWLHVNIAFANGPCPRIAQLQAASIAQCGACSTSSLENRSCRIRSCPGRSCCSSGGVEAPSLTVSVLNGSLVWPVCGPASRVGYEGTR